MDIVVFSQRLKRLLAGDEVIFPDEVKEVLRKIQTDFEVMTSFIREHQHNLIGNFSWVYESDPQFWRNKKQLIDYSHESDSAIDIFLLNINQSHESSSCSSYTVERKMELFQKFERGDIIDIINGIELLKCLMHEGNGIVSGLSPVNNSSSSSETVVKVKKEQSELINNKPRLVGREKERESLLDLLIQGDPSLSAISIKGFSHVARTVLAAEVYNSNYVKNYFDCRAWIVVSLKYNRHKIFDDILKSVMPFSLLSDVMDKDFESKRNALRDFLTNKRYLIVLDDLWNPNSRDDFIQALPNDYNRSRVLITTNDFYVGYKWDAHQLEIERLSEEDSLEKLLHSVFSKEGRRPELEPVIESLRIYCQGRPSSILYSSGLFSEKDIQDQFSKLASHCGEAENLNLRSTYWILSYSYLNLPLNLRPCFLYLAVFPEGFEIFTWHLYQLWIAEGFIHDNTEATAEEYLEDLVDAGFVQVNKRTSEGRIKLCNIYGYMWRPLIGMVNMEKFIQVHPFLDIPPLKRFKRLFIHYDDASTLDLSKYSTPYLSSLLCLGSKNNNLAEKDCNYISDQNFKLLRVLDLGTLVLQQCPARIQTLFLLRFLKLNIPSLTTIPSEICNNLLNLYTLDMPNSSIDNTIDDIWKMRKLRRLNFKLIKLHPHPRKYGKSLGNLNFISTLHPSSCTQDILSRLPKLRSLRISGNLSSYQSELSKSLCELLSLESLKLVDESEISKLSSIILNEYQFPPRLTQLSLSNTELKDDPMPILEKLQLKILKLKRNSYSGRKLACSSGGFPKLEVLQLKSMLWLQEWTMETKAMPKLECLVINPCAYLRELPEELWRIQTFNKLELWWPRPELKQSLKDFEDVERYDTQIYPSGI